MSDKTNIVSLVLTDAELLTMAWLLGEAQGGRNIRIYEKLMIATKDHPTFPSNMGKDGSNVLNNAVLYLGFEHKMNIKIGHAMATIDRIVARHQSAEEERENIQKKIDLNEQEILRLRQKLTKLDNMLEIDNL